MVGWGGGGESVFLPERKKAKISVTVVSFHFCMGLQRQPVTLFQPVSKLFNISCALFYYSVLSSILSQMVRL